jgi:hypothetical protein
MHFQVIRQIRTLGEQHQMGQTEGARDNLAIFLLINTHLRRRVTHRDRLRCERTLAAERQGIAHVLDVHRLGRQQSHIPADLLEVQRRHRNPCCELGIGHTNVRVIPVQELELVTNAPLLLAILQRNGQVIGLGSRHREGDGVVVGHRLHDAIEVICIQAHVQLGSRVVVFVMLKLVGVQPHMRQHSASVVHRNHANSILVEDQRHLHQHRLQTLSECSDGCGLHGFCYDEILGHCVCLHPGASSKFFSACLLSWL